MRYILSLLVLLCTLTTSCSQPQVRYTPEDKASYERLLERMLPHRAQPLDQLVIMTALHKLGTPYVAGTLEQDPEMLTVCMNKTDCILFVEMCLAFSLTLKEENPDFDSYCDNLLKLRYRDGIVEDYSSRIHYTSEWIRQATERDIMEEITAEIGGVIWPQEFSFMSTHTDSYRQQGKSLSCGRSALQRNTSTVSNITISLKMKSPPGASIMTAILSLQ